MRLQFAFVATAAAILATTALSPAAAVPGQVTAKAHRFASCRASQGADFAFCVATGSVDRPRAIYLHASSSPSQQVKVSWTIQCRKGQSGFRQRSGSLQATTPLRRKLRMPYRHPGSCMLAADAHLNSSGSLHLWLTART